MKKLLFLSAAIILAFACTPKASKSTAATSSATAAVGPAAPPANSVPTDAHLAAVKTKYSDATMDQLKQGHSLYFGACTRCHGANNPTRWDEKQWTGILDDMAGKASISATEKDAVWKYIMGVKLASK